MPCTAPPNRAPAFRYVVNWRPSYRDTLIHRAKKAVQHVTEVMFGCRHSNRSFPINDRQTCLDCGRVRLYVLTGDPAIFPSGIFMGLWRKAPAPESTNRVIALGVIDEMQFPYLAGEPGTFFSADAEKAGRL